MAVVDDTTTVYLLLTGILDAAKEIEKLGKKQAEAEARVGGLILSNSGGLVLSTAT